MKIVILTGSPRKKGNSDYLAEQLAKGTQEAGHVFSPSTAQNIRLALARHATVAA